MPEYYDEKFVEAERILRGEEKPSYLPQLYKIEGVDLAEPEPWPKENPYLKPAVKISADFEPLIKGIEESVAAFDKLVEKIKECLPPVLKVITDIFEAINLYPNKRVIYLATHGKGRTRKKNVKRILKWYAAQAKAPSEKRRSRGYIKYIERDGRIYAVFAQN